MIKQIVVSLILALLCLFVPSPTLAQQPEQYEAKIISIEESTDPNSMAEQTITIVPTEGRFKDQPQQVGSIISPQSQNYRVGDAIIVDVSSDGQGNPVFYISDFVRQTPLYLLFALFIVIVLIFGRKKGLFALLSMTISFLVIFFYLLPAIAAGFNPILATLTASLMILPITFYVSHGFNKATTAAVIGTLLTLVLTALLMGIFTESAKMTGFASEEASFIRLLKGDQINIKGLLYAGMLIAVIGILDDIASAQASVVNQLKKSSPHLSRMAIYKHAMEVGKDHIASLVNTLILVYTGAALPLLLLFTDSSASFSKIINYEIVAEEILRTLIGSIGLVLAVPITTLIAVRLIKSPLVENKS
jgi:uncharacterized membrane protein